MSINVTLSFSNMSELAAWAASQPALVFPAPAPAPEVMTFAALVKAPEVMPLDTAPKVEAPAPAPTPAPQPALIAEPVTDPAGVDYPTLQKAVLQLYARDRAAAAAIATEMGYANFKVMPPDLWADALAKVNAKLAEAA